MEYEDLDRPHFKRLVNAMSRAFRDSRGGGIVERFESVSKLLFLKMIDEREVADSGGLRAPTMAWRPGETSRTVYERARHLWVESTSSSEAQALRGVRGKFPDDVNAVSRCVRLMERYRLDSSGVDVKGAAYEELLRDTFEKNDNQQYFTPRHLMDFMVAMLAPSPDDVVCDPACGSGGFLVGALNYTNERWPDSTLPALRGVDVDDRMAWVARINVFLHGGSPGDVVHVPGAGSLRPWMEVRKALPKEGFTKILTNPPFGSDMTDPASLEGLKTGRGRSSRRRGALFIERCLDLLAPGGQMAVVIDDSILNLQGNADIRALIREKAIVEAVISLPDVTFMPYSTAKSSVLVVSKKLHSSQEQGAVFMADVEHVGNRPNGDPLYREARSSTGARELRSDLPEVLAAWEAYKATGTVPADFAGESMIFVTNIDNYTSLRGGDRLDANYFHPFRSRAARLLSGSQYPVVELHDLYEFDTKGINVAQTFGDESVSWIGLGDIESSTGEFKVARSSGDRIRSTAHMFTPGSILVSKLRPKLRKVVHITDNLGSGICSAELVVLRPKSSPALPVLDEYMAYMLRSDLSYGQQVHQITGIGRPRIGIPALKKLRFPIPPLEVQQEILTRLEAAMHTHRSLRKRAAELEEKADSVLGDAYASAVEDVTSRSIGGAHLYHREPAAELDAGVA